MLASLCACTPAPGQPEGGDDTSSDETGSDETGSTETGSDEAGPDEGCDACGAGQLCVATLDGEVCSRVIGYTLDCVDQPASCSDGACDPACVEALCGAGAECVPECGDAGVDVDSDKLESCDAAACCTSFCDLDDPQACAGLEPLECAAVFEPGESEHVGVCILP